MTNMKEKAVFKDFIKKYHLIGYIITIAVTAIIGFSVKWYNYKTFSEIHGAALAPAYKYFNIVLAFIIVMETVLFFFLIIKKVNMAGSFLAVALCLGSVFILLMPVNTPADEDKHMFAVTEFSNGILGIKDNEERFMATYRTCDVNSGFTRTVSISNYILMGEKLFEKAEKNAFTDYEVEHFNYQKSTFVLYFPAIIGMTISKAIGLGTVMMYLVSRFLMLLTYCLIGYFAVKALPTGKLLMAVILAMPTSLSRAACVSQDGILHACAFLFMAYVIKFAFSDEIIKVRDAIISVLAASVLILGKGGAYIPLLLLLFLIPRKNFGEKVKYPVVVATAIIYAFIIFMVSNPTLLSDFIGSGKGTEDELLWNENRSYTLKTLITHPGMSAKMFINTFAAFGGIFFGDMISGGFGWLQISSSPIIVAGCFIFILMAALSENCQTVIMNKKQRIITTISAFGAFALVVLSMWIFWTPIIYDYIAGLQGRYFILILFPVMLLFRNSRFSIKTEGEKLEKTVMPGLSVLILFSVFEIWTRLAA